MLGAVDSDSTDLCVLSTELAQRAAEHPQKAAGHRDNQGADNATKSKREEQEAQ